jgi:hypothetical protein
MEMSENSNNNKDTRNEEIDLLDLFRRIGKTLSRWGNALGRAFLISVVFIIRRWLILLLSIFLGLVISYIAEKKYPPYYTSDLVLKNNIGDNTRMIKYIGRLNSMNKDEFSEATGLSIDECENVVEIGAFWIIDKNKDKIPDEVDYSNTHDIYDTIDIRMPNYFDVRVTSLKSQNMGLIRSGVIKYIESDSTFQNINRIRINQNSELLSRFKEDIQQLDSLQKVKYFEQTRRNGFVPGGQILFLQEQQNTQLLYPEIYELYAKKQKLEIDNKLFKDIVTIQSDFTPPILQHNGIKFYARKIIPVFVLLTLFILILIANKESIKELLRKY